MENNHCSDEVLNLLKNCVKANLNLVYYGETSLDKTESADFFAPFLPENQSVVAIKDTLSWHLNPKWILLTETRFQKVVYLMEYFNDQPENNSQNDLYHLVDVGVLLKCKKSMDDMGRMKMNRCVDRIFFYDRNDEKSPGYMVVDEGKIISKNIPEFILKKMKSKGITNAFSFGGSVYEKKAAVG